MDNNITTYAQALLLKLEAPVNDKNIAFIASWAQQEGTKAIYNPLANTKRMPGSSDFNKAHVQNYSSFESGVEAQAHTLKLSYYKTILAAIKSGNPETSANAHNEWKRYTGEGDYSTKLIAGMSHSLSSGTFEIAKNNDAGSSVNAGSHAQTPDLSLNTTNTKLGFFEQASTAKNFVDAVSNLNKVCCVNQSPEQLRVSIHKLIG